MSYNLFICEKPSQAQDLARNLHASRKKGWYANSDDSIRVTWCLGHLLELCPPEAYNPQLKSWRLDTLPILPEKFKYEVKSKTADQYKIVSTLIKEAGVVTIATDYDREGEAIARTILERTRYHGPLKRLCLTALDDRSIQRALKRILDGTETQNMYQAAIARSQADWLVGMNLSRLFTILTRNSGTRSVLSVGRVQTPTVTLVTERDQAIRDFKPKPFFEVYAELITPQQEQYRATWIPNDDITDEDGRVLDRNHAERVANLIQGKYLTVTSYNKRDSRQAPMLPYDLTSLQQFCNRRYGFSASRTLATAQSLYEKHKATSYPRTDCRYIPDSQLDDASGIMETLSTQNHELAGMVLGASLNRKPRSFNQSKITAHHAIIPTGSSKVNINLMTHDERAVYDAVCRAYIAQFYPDAIYNTAEILLEGEGEHFRAASRFLAEPGWRILFGAKRGEGQDESTSAKNASEKNNGEGNDDNENNSGPVQILPECTAGENHRVENTQIADKMTTPPSHYTEATLLSAMENIHRTITDPHWKKMLKETAGLGTPATRAQIIESTVDRGYLERSGKYLLSTEKAVFMTNVIPADIRSAGMTAVWEQALESIAQGTMPPQKFMDSIVRWITHVIAENANRTITATFTEAEPAPKDATRARTTKCRTTAKSGEGEEKKTTRRRRTTSNTSGTNTVTGAGAYSSSDISSPRRTRKSATAKAGPKAASGNTSGITCPKCGSPMVLRHNRTTGEAFYGCSRYPNCRMIVKAEEGNDSASQEDAVKNASTGLAKTARTRSRTACSQKATATTRTRRATNTRYSRDFTMPQSPFNRTPAEGYANGASGFSHAPSAQSPYSCVPNTAPDNTKRNSNQSQPNGGFDPGYMPPTENDMPWWDDSGNDFNGSF